MLKVGITGGIGSGKSLVCSMFSLLGVPVYEADTAAKKLYDTDPILKQAMIDLLGEDIYRSGTIDRQQLASIIFSDPQQLQQVNEVVHPAVERDFLSWAKMQANAPYVLQETAILFEAGMEHLFDKIITVSAPLPVRQHRLLQRAGGMNLEEINRRISMQWTEEEKIAQSDFVLYNDDSTPLLPQLLRVHEALLALAV